MVALGGCGEVISYNRQFRQQGVTQFESGAYTDAASSFQNAIRQEPGDYTSHYYLGQCYDKMHMPQQGIKEYQTCLNVMDHSMEGKTDREMRLKVVEGLATSIASQTDHTTDLAMLDSGTKTAENAWVAAKVYRKIGDPDMAIQRFDQAQLIDPKDPAIAKEYGLYLEQLGQTRRADPQLRRAYALNDKDEEVAAALRRIGVVPGPSLKNEQDLQKPLIPVGPIPEVDFSTSNKQQSPGNSGAVGSTSPRD
jgi:Tfp pilus assembly protein PilF